MVRRVPIVGTEGNLEKREPEVLFSASHLEVLTWEKNKITWISGSVKIKIHSEEDGKPTLELSVINIQIAGINEVNSTSFRRINLTVTSSSSDIVEVTPRGTSLVTNRASGGSRISGRTLSYI